MDGTPLHAFLDRWSAITSTPLSEDISLDSAYESLESEADVTLCSIRDNCRTTDGGSAEQTASEDRNGNKETAALTCSKVQPWRLCKLGSPHVDFLKELRPFSPILWSILAHLSGKDLAAVCRTSGSWRRACLAVQEAAERWRGYISLRQEIYETNRENLPSKEIVNCRSGKSEPLASLDCNVSLVLDIPKGSVSNLPKTRFQIFVEEAANLEDDEVHRPCPACGYPSRVSRTTGEGVCKSKTCGHRLCPWYLPHPGQKGSFDAGQLIGTAASKKNLRRL